MPFIVPSGRKVVLAGNPIIEELNVETATNVKPGRLVKKGTAATDVIVNTAGGVPAGWVGWDAEGVHPKISPATRDTAYVATNKVPIVYGPVILVGKLASGQNVTKDTYLIPAANGELIAAATQAIVAGAVAVTSAAANGASDLTGSIPPSGPIVAQAKENKDASAGALDIVVESLI